MRVGCHLVAAMLTAMPLAVAGQTTCVLRDFLSLPLPKGDPVVVALETAYPGSRADPVAGQFTTADGQTIPLGPARDIGPAERLEGSTIGDQFAYSYPIDFENPRGSFKWRVIAGTDRLSSHSFGSAIDLNSEIGGYWRWSGRPN